MEPQAFNEEVLHEEQLRRWEELRQLVASTASFTTYGTITGRIAGKRVMYDNEVAEEQDLEAMKKLPKTVIFVGEGVFDDRNLYVKGNEDDVVPGYPEGFRAGKSQIESLKALCEKQGSGIVLGIKQRFEDSVIKYLTTDCGLPILDSLPEKPMPTMKPTFTNLVWTWLSKNSDWIKMWNVFDVGTRPKTIAKKFPQFVILEDSLASTATHRRLNRHFVKTDFFYGGFSACDLDRANALFEKGPGIIEARAGIIEPEPVIA